MNIRKLLIIAKYTFSELYKSKVLINTFLIGLGILLVTYVASEFSYGVPQKIALDFGVGITSIVTVVISILMGVGLISKEIENRTLYMVLSRPIERSTFILGRSLGMILLLTMNVLILTTISYSLYFIMGGAYSSLLLWTTLFLILECAIILSTVVLFSLITNNVLAVLNSVVIYIVGHALSGLADFNVIKNSSELTLIIESLAYIIPDFSKLNIKQFLIYKNELSSDYLISSGLYGITFLIALNIASTLIFNNKNLD